MIEVINEYSFFKIDDSSGIRIELNLKNNAGINNEFMEANSELKIENTKRILTSSKESSRSINKIINILITLSQAGNNLSTKLYENIKIPLENMIDYINNEINSLFSLIKYKDISDIFDSTLSLDSINRLPYKIIEESSNLKTQLEQLLNNIENDSIKDDLKILHINIYDYNKVSHQIINILIENFSELGKSLNSTNSKLTEISNYYLNNTCNSYLSIIEEAEKILMNYYKDELYLINLQVDQILEVFENSLNNSLKKQNNIINILFEKMDNGYYIIENSNLEEIKLYMNNLYYIKNYQNELILKIKKKVKKEMNIKNNGYLLTDYDINSIKERSINLINNAKKVAKKLDNDEYIDKKFDEIMIHFRKNFTNILQFMDREKNEKFPLNDKILNEGPLSDEVLNKFGNQIVENGVNILNSIRRENEYYLKEKEILIGEFIKNEKDYLNRLIFEIDSLFTEKKIEELAQLYEIAFKSCLLKTKNELNNNKNAAINYLNDMVKYFQNDTELLDLLKQYKIDENNLLESNPYTSHNEYKLEDIINTKYRTDLYSSKYETFLESFSKSKNFINFEIYKDLLTEYKSIIFKIREILQKFKNNKMSIQYPDTSEFFFIDNHLHIIEKLYNIFNNKISDSIFNNNFIQILDDFKKEANNNLNNIDTIMNQNHNIIKSKPITKNIIYDFCISFNRKITYTSTSGSIAFNSETDTFCFPIFDNQLVSHSIYNDNNYIKFINSFNDFYAALNDRINKYTFKITNLKKALLKTETFAINKNYTLNYLIPMKNTINS